MQVDDHSNIIWHFCDVNFRSPADPRDCWQPTRRYRLGLNFFCAFRLTLQRRKLDAVYYYMRSLAASNPFLSAKESLMTLFDEVRKSCEAIDRQRKIQKDKGRTTKAQMALPELAR